MHIWQRTEESYTRVAGSKPYRLVISRAGQKPSQAVVLECVMARVWVLLDGKLPLVNILTKVGHMENSRESLQIEAILFDLARRGLARRC